MLDQGKFDINNLSPEEKQALVEQLTGEGAVSEAAEQEISSAPQKQAEKTADFGAQAEQVGAESEVVGAKTNLQPETTTLETSELSEDDKKKALLGAMYAGDNVSDFELAKAIGFYPEQEEE